MSNKNKSKIRKFLQDRDLLDLIRIIVIIVILAFLFKKLFFSDYEVKKTPTFNNFFDGKYAKYYKEGPDWYYSFFYEEKRYDVPLHGDPKEFENIGVRSYGAFTPKDYLVLVTNNNSNLSVIAASNINLARIFNIFGYYANKNLFVAFFDRNGTVKVYDTNYNLIDQGPLDCSHENISFIILETNKNELLILNNSCVFLYGNNSKLLDTVDLFTVLFTYNFNIK